MYRTIFERGKYARNWWKTDLSVLRHHPKHYLLLNLYFSEIRKCCKVFSILFSKFAFFEHKRKSISRYAGSVTLLLQNNHSYSRGDSGINRYNLQHTTPYFCFLRFRTSNLIFLLSGRLYRYVRVLPPTDVVI